MNKPILLCVLTALGAFPQAQTPLTITQSAGSATGEIRMQERRTNGREYAGFRAPESVASNIVWALPNVDGTPGQFIKTDGAGGLGWGDGAGYWTLSGSNIYRSTGVVTIGHTSPTVRLGQNFNTNYSGNFGGMALNVFSATAGHGSVIDFNKSANGTLGAHGAVASGDTLGFFVFRGSDGSNFQRAAEVIGEVDGTVSSGVVPGRLRLSTASPSGVMTERLRIDKDGMFTLNGSVYFTGQFVTPQTISVASIQNHLTLIQPNSIGAYNPACMVLASSDTVTSAVYGSARICSGYESASFADDKFAIQTATGSGVYQDALTIKNQVVTLAGDLVATAGSFSLSSGTMAGTMRPLFTNTGSIGDVSYRYASAYAKIFDSAQSGSTGDYMQTRKLQLFDNTGSSTGASYWDLNVVMSGVGAGQNSYFYLRDNGGNTVWRADKIASGGAVATTTIYTDLLPDSTANGRDLGKTTQRWDEINGASLDLSGAANITGNLSAAVINATGSPAYRVSGTTVINASRDATFVGLTTSGAVSLASSTIVASSTFSSDLIATSGSTYALGSNAVRWLAYLNNTNINGTVTLNGTITGDLIPTSSNTYINGSSSSYWNQVASETLYVENSGRIRPRTANTGSVGISSARFNKGWFTDLDLTGTITAPSGATYNGTTTCSADQAVKTIVVSQGLITSITCATP